MFVKRFCDGKSARSCFRVKLIWIDGSFGRRQWCFIAYLNFRKSKTGMNQSLLQYPYQNLPYECLIENHIDHLLSEYARLSTDDTRPQFWSVTTTYVPFEKLKRGVGNGAASFSEKRYDQLPISPRRCIALFEQLYVHILPSLISNFERANKRGMQPLTYVYVDDPSSKTQKPYACLPPIEKCCTNGLRSSLEHPETTPHCHAVMLVGPSLRHRFDKVAPRLEQLFKSSKSCQSHSACRSFSSPPSSQSDVLRFQVPSLRAR